MAKKHCHWQFLAHFLPFLGPLQARIVPHPEDASEVNQTNLIIYCQKQQLGDNSP